MVAAAREMTGRVRPCFVAWRRRLLAVAWATIAVTELRAGIEDAVLTTITAIVESPAAYRDKRVTVTGRFRGRSAAPEQASILRPLNRDRWDFILQSQHSAIWVSGRRPRGDGFDLEPLSVVDATVGRMLQVTGRLHVRKESGQMCRPASYCTQPWIEASAIQLATAWEETTIVVPRVAGPPPKVVFNDPALEEINVPRSTSVRLQFSEDMDAATFDGRVRVSYVASGPPPPVPAFTIAYKDGTKSLEIRFAALLERFHEVKVELLDGIAARDGQQLPPWTSTFSTGAR
jgi:Bacterial Ig-like domain